MPQGDLNPYASPQISSSASAEEEGPEIVRSGCTDLVGELALARKWHLLGAIVMAPVSILFLVFGVGLLWLAERTLIFLLDGGLAVLLGGCTLVLALILWRTRGAIGRLRGRETATHLAAVLWQVNAALIVVTIISAAVLLRQILTLVVIMFQFEEV